MEALRAHPAADRAGQGRADAALHRSTTTRRSSCCAATPSRPTSRCATWPHAVMARRRGDGRLPRVRRQTSRAGPGPAWTAAPSHAVPDGGPGRLTRSVAGVLADPVPRTAGPARQSSRTRSSSSGGVDHRLEAVGPCPASSTCAAAGRCAGGRRRTRAGVVFSVSPPSSQPACRSRFRIRLQLPAAPVVGDRVADRGQPRRSWPRRSRRRPARPAPPTWTYQPVDGPDGTKAPWCVLYGVLSLANRTSR